MAQKSSQKPTGRPAQKAIKQRKNSGLQAKSGLPVAHWVMDALAVGLKQGLRPTAKAMGKPALRPADRHGRIFIVANTTGAQAWLAGHLEGVPSWQRDSALKSMPESVLLADDEGPIWVLMPRSNAANATPSQGAANATPSQGGAFAPSPYGRVRDLVGACVSGFREYKLERVTLSGFACTRDHWLGALTGLDLGAYRFVQANQKGADACKLPGLRLPDEVSRDVALIDQAAATAYSMNIARHLVNLPGNALNPTTYASIVTDLFKGSKTTSVKVLGSAELVREGMNLLQAVGAASPNPPCLVHVRYRPPGYGRKPVRGKGLDPAQSPIAFVGKGVTFDTGGLDIKPSSGMRWMKKDMGGSATTVGLALYVDAMKPARACDFYLAIAENSVSSTAMRPGDIFRARNGLTVEIHNTDAEGRLVMADAFDYALTRPGDDEPGLLIDTSTLTGAMRVAVGLTISGMFATHDYLADACVAAGQQSGDPCWRLPLFDEYKSALKSQAADLSNCSDSGFGGAITAALFLEKFTRGKPWIHLDYYAWNDRPVGAIAEPGGNGQGLQLLIRLLAKI